MDEDSSQIADRIRATRQELGANLRQLEHRLQDTKNLRALYERYPWVFVGAAFAGGVLLAAAVSGYRHSATPPRERHATAASTTAGIGSDDDRLATTESWNRLKDALVAVAAAQIRTFLRDIIPGFGETDRYAREPETSATRSQGGRGIKGENGHGFGEVTAE